MTTTGQGACWVPGALTEPSRSLGIVTLTRALDPTTGTHGDLIPVAIRLMWDVDGVVDIIDRLGQSQPVTHTQSPPPDSGPGPAGQGALGACPGLPRSEPSSLQEA